jgi:hypothetical protein
MMVSDWLFGRVIGRAEALRLRCPQLRPGFRRVRRVNCLSIAEPTESSQPGARPLRPALLSDEALRALRVVEQVRNVSTIAGVDIDEPSSQGVTKTNARAFSTPGAIRNSIQLNVIFSEIVEKVKRTFHKYSWH